MDKPGNESEQGEKSTAQELPPQIKHQIEMQMVNNMLSQLPMSGVIQYPTQFDCVRAFGAVARGRGICHIGSLAAKTPANVIEGRIKVIDEEVNKELIPALKKLADSGNYSLEQLTDALDQIVDSVYVILGAGINLGLPYDTAFGIVHSYNMRKVLIPGGPKFNDAGKVMKPEGWISPDKDLFNLVLEAFKEATHEMNQAKAKIPQRAENPEGKSSLLQEGDGKGNGSPNDTTLQ